jgi:hypothetical protein
MQSLFLSKNQTITCRNRNKILFRMPNKEKINMTRTLLVMLKLGLHLAAVASLSHISGLISNNNLREAVEVSIITAFCILLVGWALAVAESWLGE